MNQKFCRAQQNRWQYIKKICAQNILNGFSIFSHYLYLSIPRFIGRALRASFICLHVNDNIQNKPVQFRW